MTFKKVVVVDGRDHMLGRLASLVAKELLLGQPEPADFKWTTEVIALSLPSCRARPLSAYCYRLCYHAMRVCKVSLPLPRNMRWAWFTHAARTHTVTHTYICPHTHAPIVAE